MAPLPTESTNRMVVDYTWRDRPYSVLYRFVDPTLSGTIITALNTFHAAVVDRFYNNWTVPGSALLYLQGNTFSTPLTGISPTAGTGGVDPGTHPDSYQVQILGRSAGGRRASWFYQGFKWIVDANQRVLSTDNADVLDLLASFVTLRTAGITTINGQPPALKGYVNLIFNDYLTRRSRTG